MTVTSKKATVHGAVVSKGTLQKKFSRPMGYNCY